MGDPTPREVTDFDASFEVGAQFRNRFQEHDHAPASRIIQVVEKYAGNTIGYQVVEEYRVRRSTDEVKVMSTKNLLEKYEPMPVMEGEAPSEAGSE